MIVFSSNCTYILLCDAFFQTGFLLYKIPYRVYLNGPKICFPNLEIPHLQIGPNQMVKPIRRHVTFKFKKRERERERERERGELS